MESSRRTAVYLLIYFSFAIGIGWVANSVRADAQDDYKRIIGEAVHEYDLEHWPVAIELFQKAHELKPNARTLRGMGLAAFEDQRYVDAVRWLTEALEHPVQALTKPMQAEIKPVLARAKECVGYYRLDKDPVNLTIEIDGRPALIENGKLTVDPGERRLVAKADGFEPFNRSLTVKGGDNGILGIKLEPVSSPSGQTEPVALVKPQKPARIPSEGSSPSKVLPWVLIGAGVAMAAGGGVLIGLTFKDISKVKNADGTLSELEDAQRRVPIFSGAGFALAAVGVVSAATGVILLATSDSASEETEAKRPIELGVGWASLSLKGGF
jgi:hypothetical protein